jgi:uncharacterized small protein (DUF1192 family)
MSLPSQDTLRPGEGANAGTAPITRTTDSQKIMDQALQYLNDMNKTQRKRWLDYLLGASASSAVWDNPPTDYAEHNHKSIEANGNYVNKEELETTLQDMGFSDEDMEKCAELFYEAVENKVADDESSLQYGIRQLLTDDVFALLFDEEGIDIVNLLASYGEFLEEQIALVQEEALRLQTELKNRMLARHASLTENLDLNGVDALWQSCDSLDSFEQGLEDMRTGRSYKRSTVDELLTEADESNADAYFNVQRSGNRAMDNYVATLERLSSHDNNN